MFTLCVRNYFSAAHRLENYHGKCEELHGHNFLVEAMFAGEKPDRDGMVMDFTVLKGYLNQVLQGLDHAYINDIPFFQARASSSEYIALYVYGELKKVLRQSPVRITEVRVWESETAWVSYHE